MVSQPVSDDSSLIKRITQQDDTALAELYDRYARVLYAVAFKSLGSKEEAEEVVLDVFSQVWRIAERYDSRKARVDTWLFMLTRSRVLDRPRPNASTTTIPLTPINQALTSGAPTDNRNSTILNPGTTIHRLRNNPTRAISSNPPIYPSTHLLIHPLIIPLTHPITPYKC
ncbi:RNA polymerase sigma factor [Leptodesmis sp.]|uniref:RNA polymerase sigma factor n=1 Tax=Leptodesmis sp. TaxID=3100501 RepID=UPI0040534A19